MQGGNGQVQALIESGIASRLGRQHGVDSVEIVVSCEPVVAQKIVWLPAWWLQFVNLHGHTGDEGSDMVGRPAEHAVGEISDPAMANHPPLQVVASSWAHEVDRVAPTIFLVCEIVAVRGIGFEVVQPRHRISSIAERGMTGHIIDAFRTYVDDASIAQRFKMFLPGAKHRVLHLTEPCQVSVTPCALADAMQAGNADAGTLPRRLREGLTVSLQLLTRGLLLSIRCARLQAGGLAQGKRLLALCLRGFHA